MFIKDTYFLKTIIQEVTLSKCIIITVYLIKNAITMNFLPRLPSDSSIDKEDLKFLIFSLTHLQCWVDRNVLLYMKTKINETGKITILYKFSFNCPKSSSLRRFQEKPVTEL